MKELSKEKIQRGFNFLLELRDTYSIPRVYPMNPLLKKFKMHHYSIEWLIYNGHLKMSNKHGHTFQYSWVSNSPIIAKDTVVAMLSYVKKECAIKRTDRKINRNKTNVIIVKPTADKNKKPKKKSRLKSLSIFWGLFKFNFNR